MASQPNPLLPFEPEVAQNEGRRLSYDEAWDQIESLFGSAAEAYAEYGGAEAFHRQERAAWDEADIV